MRLTGLVLTIIGLWFGGSGFLGKDNLKRLEGHLNDLSAQLIILPKKAGKYLLMNLVDAIFTKNPLFEGCVNDLLKLGFSMVLVSCFMLVLFLPELWKDPSFYYGIFTFLMSTLGNVVIIVVVGIIIFLILLPSSGAIMVFLLALLLWVLTVPYQLTGLIIKRLSLDRALLFFGALFGTVGTLILYFAKSLP